MQHFAAAMITEKMTIGWLVIKQRRLVCSALLIVSRQGILM